MKEAIAFFAGLITMMIVWFCSDYLGDGAYRRGYRQAVKDANKYEEYINEAPTIEPKKGKWILLDDGYTEWLKCSCCNECLFETLGNKTNYCPNCGADMRGEQDG